jgi:Histidine phosphatase superfamily (branch 2)
MEIPEEAVSLGLSQSSGTNSGWLRSSAGDAQLQINFSFSPANRPRTLMTRPSTSDSDSWIPMAEMENGPRESNSIDEELDTLLVHGDPKKPKWGMRPRLGACFQIAAFILVGLLILVVSGLLAYYTLHNDKAPQPIDFVHAPLPDMKNPGLLRYFGGMGPYIGGEYTPVPHSCSVTQLHMISRHGERYPTSGMGVHIEQFAANVAKAPELNWNSELGFLNGWSLESDGFMTFPEVQWDQETLTGPAAGSLRMFSLGSEFRTRYSTLWEWGASERIRVWAADMTRVIDSAKYFAQGFFGIDADVQYEVIPETADQWGNTLTPAYA